MTAELRDELLKVAPGPQSCRRAQVACALRMCAEIRVSRGGLKIIAELPTASSARMLRRELRELFGVDSVTVGSRSTSYLGGSFILIVDAEQGGARLAKEAGLIDRYGDMVWGLPTSSLAWTPGEVAAALRGAFIVAGAVSGPVNGRTFELKCPSPEVAHALASFARRSGVTMIVRELRGVARLTVRDTDHIGTLIAMMGANDGRMVWERHSARQATIMRAQLAQANQCRAVRAAATTANRIAEALEILGADAPEHLAATGQLRVAKRRASLEELGRMSDPPLSKDAVAGRLRRLLALADKHQGPKPHLVSAS
ncbi:putative sporulation transcription regulator WhiA [Mycolicibacillus koreensis]|nr:putative sporulation transcription regulator WhiA [Mycolicibacillus koreensis]